MPSDISTLMALVFLLLAITFSIVLDVNPEDEIRKFVCNLML
jgi:hypothetical protein